MARLAIADPPYPPQFSVRYDDVRDPAGRITTRSRATRWYGDTGEKGTNAPKPADFHPEANEWDHLERHRQLIVQLVAQYDGFALATTPDGLGAYHPLPVAARVMAWVRTRPQPGGHRLHSMWEAVVLLTPAERRPRASGLRVPDVLTTPAPAIGFAGSKPAEWTRWVLDAMGYDPETDTVHDMFPGSGAVTNALAQGVLL